MWNGPPVDDEVQDALKARFIELCVKHNANFFLRPDLPAQIGKYVFNENKLPELNGEIMGVAWSKDFEVMEAIELGLVNGGVGGIDASEQALIRRALQIADEKTANVGARLTAIRLAGELQGMVKKGVEGGKGPASGGSAADLLANIAKALPN